jgi:hypothetical protein
MHDNFMSGPAYGKLLLKDAKIFINTKEIDGNAYIHVRGYARARVTHLDIESNELNKVYPSEGGSFLSIYGIDNGIEIKVNERCTIKILHPMLNRVLSPGEKTRTWVGGKEEGIYIGFKKKEIEKLESIVREYFKFKILEFKLRE